MLTVDDGKETIHLYVVREEAGRPSLLPPVLSVLALLALLTIGVLSPYQQPVMRVSLRVPAVLLPLKTFQATVTVIPTGSKTYPATTAQGRLTITNGSIIAQIIPEGFLVAGAVTERAVFVPAGSANGFGVATVAAQAVVKGKAGNLPALAVNQVIGTSTYIRNLTAFAGGQDAYAVPVQLPQDRQIAVERARATLFAQLRGLHYPCREVVNNQPAVVKLTLTCQFVTYQVPVFLHVTSVRFFGKQLLVNAIFVARPLRFWTK